MMLWLFLTEWLLSVVHFLPINCNGENIIPLCHEYSDSIAKYWFHHSKKLTFDCHKDSDKPASFLLRKEQNQKLISNSNITSIEENHLITEALSNIVSHELIGCGLVLAYDETFRNSAVLHLLVMMSHFRQVLMVQNADDFLSLSWVSPLCTGFIFLLQDPDPLLTFMDEDELPWDYQGKFILVGFPEEHLDAIAVSKKGKKTQHIIALVEKQVDEILVYMNLLFWGDGMVIVNRFRSRRFTSDAKIFPDKISDLRGRNLTLVTFEFKPHVIYDENAEEGKQYYGRDIKIAQTLGQILNFSVVIKNPPHGEYWGSPMANGSWDGMIGILQRNEGHFGMACVFITDNGNMVDFVDLARFYDADKSCFVLPVEKPLPRWQSLVAPFQMETWLAFATGLFLFSPVLFFIVKSSFNVKEKEKALHHLPYTILWTFGVHLRQPQAHTAWGIATQVWVIFLWLYVIILTTGYSCNLTAFLTIAKPRQGMETIQELHSSGLGVLAYGLYFKMSMEESDNMYLQNLAKRYRSLPEMIDSYNLLEDDNRAFIGTRTFHEYHILTNFTYQGVPSMRIMKECYTLYHMTIALQKHLPVKERFDNTLRKLFDAGISRKWYLDILRLHQKKITNPDTSEEEASDQVNGNSVGRPKGAVPLGLDHLRGIFYANLIGLVVASLIAAAEVAWFKGHIE